MQETAAALAALASAGFARGEPLALVTAPGLGLALAAGGAPVLLPGGELAAVVGAVEQAFRPRWVLWSQASADALVAAGVRVATCWDISAVHRLLAGGGAADPARAWAQVHQLAPEAIPAAGPPDLFTEAAGQDPVGPDGHLDPGWVAGGWAADPDRLGRWAALAWTVARRQRAGLSGRALATACSESTAQLLCAELGADGLPMDRLVAEEVLAGVLGPRPRSAADVAAGRARRDAAVLAHAPPGYRVDLRSPGQVRELLAAVGVDVPDTRAWRLQAVAEGNPLVAALLAWRRAERLASTYGYDWLDAQLGADGRLRGCWSGSDGAAGRMTASAGLHNMPALMRAAVVADPGWVFVRADLGQIEPRVLAAVSGDRELARASRAPDLYAPVAADLGVDRNTAKVAVLGAMYGQSSGHGGTVLGQLRRAYPVAMAYLEAADQAGRAGRSVRTYGGRLIAAGAGPPGEGSGARGRYARNAVVQGAAAELFKAWAVTVRARGAPLGGRIVLCLHDELLVHVPAPQGSRLARLLEDCLQEAVRGWAPGGAVAFPADIKVIERWSEAKAAAHPRLVAAGEEGR